MLSISSNITDVIARLEKLRSDVPDAMQKALSPALWFEEAQETARQVITTIASAGEQQWIDRFVKGVSAAIWGEGLLLSLSPQRAAGVLTQMSLPEAGAGTFGPLELTDPSDWPAIENSIREWVEDEKRWDERRDGPRTPDNIERKAQWIFYCLVAPDGDKFIVRDGDNAGQTVRDVFMPYILEFLAKKQNAGMDPAMVDRWLRAVLAAWRIMVRARYPERVREILRARGAAAMRKAA